MVRTWYVLGVKSTYFYVRVHTHTDHTHTSFPIRIPCNPHESPSDACLTLCGQHPAYPKSPQLSGLLSEDCHVQTATATGLPHRRCCRACHRPQLSKTVRTRYVPVRTSIRLEKYVLLASSTYFYHDSCTQYVPCTYCSERYVLGTYLE